MGPEEWKGGPALSVSEGARLDTDFVWSGGVPQAGQPQCQQPVPWPSTMGDGKKHFLPSVALEGGRTLTPDPQSVISVQSRFNVLGCEGTRLYLSRLTGSHISFPS